jgi:hypothetical protein
MLKLIFILNIYYNINVNYTYLNMKVYKIELLIIDHEDIGDIEIINILENNKFINPKVMDIENKDIGEWYDEHPLNLRNKQKEEYIKLFK